MNEKYDPEEKLGQNEAPASEEASRLIDLLGNRNIDDAELEKLGKGKLNISSQATHNVQREKDIRTAEARKKFARTVPSGGQTQGDFEITKEPDEKRKDDIKWVLSNLETRTYIDTEKNRLRWKAIEEIKEIVNMPYNTTKEETREKIEELKHLCIMDIFYRADAQLKGNSDAGSIRERTAAIEKNKLELIDLCRHAN